jgi:hypothetical protein
MRIFWFCMNYPLKSKAPERKTRKGGILPPPRE